MLKLEFVIEADRQMQEEILRLEKDNNRMLHSMRRNAFWGGLFKLLIWAGLIAVPIWFYSTYMAPVVQSFQQTINQVQGTGAKAQVQLDNFQDMLKRFSSQFKSDTPAAQ